MYGFAHFTSTLNEPEEGVAPTDCRFRPDQRIMEEGDFPKADKEKVGTTVAIITDFAARDCVFSWISGANIFHALCNVSLTASS